MLPAKEEGASRARLFLENLSVAFVILHRHTFLMGASVGEDGFLDSYKYFFDNSKEAFAMTDAFGKIVEANSSFLEMLGLDEYEVKEANISNFAIGDGVSHLEKELVWEGYKKEFPLVMKSKNGELNCSIAAHLWKSEDGRVLGFHFVIKDETQAKNEYDRIFKLACYDGLTELYNRRYFFEIGELEFARSRRYGHPCVVVMTDIDNFKSINDSYGHNVGDIVLHKIAQGCKSSLRRADLIGRYGGEEFAIILVETDIEEAKLVAERIRSGIADDVIAIASGNINVSISLGLADLSPECASLSTLLERADASLYQAKDAGKNTFRIYGTQE